jgi:pyruvate/2-oxoglutarate dehydrogenase complex dihydrolipoamide dehydrogenase (E3) component
MLAEASGHIRGFTATREGGRQIVSEIEEFDVVVVGAGPAGEVCAAQLAEAKLSVALVEQDLVGGECAYYACMPSKALLRPAQALAEARRVAGAAQAATGSLDAAAALARRDEMVHGLDDGAQLPWLEDRGITLLRGHGELVGERRVRVAGQMLGARRAVVLATGSATAIPPISGLREARPWGNREATTAKRIPRSLLVLGGGVVAVELAQAYRSLGAHVTIVEALDRLISHEEEFASTMVRDSLEAGGVEVVLGAKAVAVERGAGSPERGPVTVELDDGRALGGEELLVAVGREPHTHSLGLDSLGIEGGGFLAVDDTMRVPGHDWLYAIGDINGRVLLTHMGKYQARLVADHILGRAVALRSDGALSPRVIFTEPQVAAVGHTLASARAAGLDALAIDKSISAVAGESFVGHGAPGTARIVVDVEREVLLGATFVGVETAEWLHAATISVIAEVPIERLWHAVPSFPTRSEIWLRLLEEYARLTGS